MSSKPYIKAIVKGAELYFRAFSLASNMCHHEGRIEWIAPIPGEKGPAIVYKSQLSSLAEEEICKLLPELQAGNVPALWALTPLSTPEGLADILAAKGFKNITNKERPEYGMAFDMNGLITLSQPNKNIKIIKVKTPIEFQAWINVVNTALHEWELLTAKHYAVWLEQEALAFYLGFINGVPVSTAATIKDGSNASLEFVSTLNEYRRHGAAYAVCLKALQSLQECGAEMVTLRSSFEGAELYEKLGFRPYYEQQLFSFQNKS